jgi:four helix bundle protein
MTEDGEMREGRARKKFDLLERLIQFACLIIDIVDSLAATRAGNHVAGQLVRCGTSPAANYAEAAGAESRMDFVHKSKVVLKELRETNVWLEMTKRKELSSRPPLVVTAITECGELTAIFRTSISTAERNMRRQTTLE